MNSARTPSTGREKILLVEDSLDQAHLVTFLLEQAGYRVTLAQDGIRGAQLAEDGVWALVITDLNLPGTAGVDVIAASRRHSPDTPVLIFTGHAGERILDDALRAGADDVIEKPLDRDELLEKVEVLVKSAQRTRGRDELRVLAVGAYPGAAEFGIGGTLLNHAATGNRIILCPLTDGSERGDSGSLRQAATEAAESLGASLPPWSALPGELDEEAATAFLLRIVGEFRPHVIYAQSSRDDEEEVRAAHRATVSAAGGVPSVICFESITTAVGYRPDRFEDIGDVLQEKLSLLRPFRGHFYGDDPADPELVRSVARYWGRRVPSYAAEALEIVWSS